MGDFNVSVSFTLDSQAAQFIGKLERAAEETMQELSEKGAAISRDLAPIGKKPDPRTPRLKDSITSSYSASSAKWSATARHALITEYGGGPAIITGEVSFFWDRQGRMWKPGPNFINHPATRAQPYLRPAFEAMMAEWADVARRFYPQ